MKDEQHIKKLLWRRVMERINRKIKDLQDNFDIAYEALKEATWSLEGVESELYKITEGQEYKLGSLILNDSETKSTILNSLIENKPINLPNYIKNELIRLFF